MPTFRHPEATRARVKELVTTTRLPFAAVAAKAGTAVSTVLLWRAEHGWTRPQPSCGMPARPRDAWGRFLPTWSPDDAAPAPCDPARAGADAPPAGPRPAPPRPRGLRGRGAGRPVDVLATRLRAAAEALLAQSEARLAKTLALPAREREARVLGQVGRIVNQLDARQASAAAAGRDSHDSDAGRSLAELRDEFVRLLDRVASEEPPGAGDRAAHPDGA